MPGFKTVLFNAALAAFGVLEATDWTSVIGEKAGIVVLGISIVGLILRSMTSTPLFKGK